MQYIWKKKEEKQLTEVDEHMIPGQKIMIGVTTCI